MPSVLIVDDHLLVRQGLRQILSQEYRGLVFGEAADSEGALAQIGKRKWDLILLDTSLPQKDGFQVLREIRERDPAACVLLVSTKAEPEHVPRAVRLGAAGCVSKTAGRSDLMRAIKTVLAGKTYFEGSKAPEPESKVEPRHHGLSARECGVMLALASGKRVSEVAAELGLSVKTVSTYKARVLSKLNVESVADLVRYMIEHNLFGKPADNQDAGDERKLKHALPRQSVRGVR